MANLSLQEYFPEWTSLPRHAFNPSPVSRFFKLRVTTAVSDVGLSNHWSKRFEHRSKTVVAISDEEMLAWINDDNYTDLAPRLAALGFEGWIPDPANLQGHMAFAAGPCLLQLWIH
ncbi:hypothetical protein E2F43_14190 [Seongchinamella unica]|uniref:Uncharacterized protein n=1 Tax=Seongchinamella unica TaxID=2547392 RepID=A0A4R5LQ89_9GAMM|nr:hypothetical protein [Seongchinamella unica]TDG12722.1 hypothetical protein E2F43_14190 [Seongchinamella unica]